jgi:heterodisulfide reductase subunit A
MVNTKNVGLFFFNRGVAEPDAIKYSELIEYAKEFSEVNLTKEYDNENQIDFEKVSKDIRANDIQRVVIASDSPGAFKNGFSRALKLAGKNPTSISLANFNDHGASISDSTERAKAILACAIYDVPFEVASNPDESDLNENTLIIGGGIAGIQAALEIGNAGYKVYLVEKAGTIGGHMAMFDKTFPTLDCAACILTPKMVEVGQHPNIEILSYSEVKKVEGEAGDFKVVVNKKARRVDQATCVACGICSDVCPTKVPSEFDAEVSLRKAIYIPFPQAVPNKYLVDEENCLYVKAGKCGVCAKKCPADAINLDEKDEEVEINVGNIIVTTGYKIFDAKNAKNYGYGDFPNVITSLEFERIVNASGPTGGKLKKKTKDKKGKWVFSSKGEDPKSVAIIHCIGSRDENYNKYCSRVCCMYSLKFAHLVKEKVPEAEVFEYYIDMRAFGKDYEEFYERIKSEGINLIRGRTAKIEEVRDKLKLRSEDIINDRLDEREVDVVILSVAIEPGEDFEELSKMLNISRTQDGWFMERNPTIATTETFTGGISIAGACQGPKDIPDSVVQASSAASKVLQTIMKKRIKRSIKEIPLEVIENRAKNFFN